MTGLPDSTFQAVPESIALGNSIAAKASRTSQFNNLQQATCDRFNVNYLQTTKFHKAQQGFECGSGPRGVYPAHHLANPFRFKHQHIFRLLKTVES